MKVILSQNVKNLGVKGDVVNVSDGYANNFLLKNKLAVVANGANLNINAMEKAALAKKIKEETESAKALARELEKVNLVLGLQVGDSGKAFGSVGQKEIAEKLGEMGFAIDRKKIDLDNPIKTPGTYTITIKLYKGVVGKVGLVVEKNK